LRSKIWHVDIGQIVWSSFLKTSFRRIDIDNTILFHERTATTYTLNDAVVYHKNIDGTQRRDAGNGRGQLPTISAGI